MVGTGEKGEEGKRAQIHLLVHTALSSELCVKSLIQLYNTLTSHHGTDNPHNRLDVENFDVDVLLLLVSCPGNSSVFFVFVLFLFCLFVVFVFCLFVCFLFVFPPPEIEQQLLFLFGFFLRKSNSSSFLIDDVLFLVAVACASVTANS